MQIAEVAASRSTCMRRQVGAVAVLNRQILATGYNGAPAGIAHCSEAGCIRQRLGVASGERHELCRGLHAEQNLIIQTAVNGTKIGGATVYCTHHPCVVCTKMLINAQVVRVVFRGDYPDELSHTMLREAGVEVCVLS